MSIESRGNNVRSAIAFALAGGTTASAAWAGEAETPKPFTEVIVTAPYGAGIDVARVPSSVQFATAEDIERLHAMDVTELLNRSFAGVNINHAQNNPLQPDVNFRGFTASPLLGLPQGLAVYQNGVRINEPFGDTVNWVFDEAGNHVHPGRVDHLRRLWLRALVALADPGDAALGDPDRDVGHDPVLLLARAAEHCGGVRDQQVEGGVGRCHAGVISTFRSSTSAAR